MREAETYRKFAQECRRMAETASAKDRAVLMQIAEAWEAQARRAETRNGKNGGREEQPDSVN
jgi:hypothetical protein